MTAAALGVFLAAGGCSGFGCRSTTHPVPPPGTWSALPGEGAPPAALEQAGAWTGSELVIFGGAGPCSPAGVCGDGGRLDPAAGWSPLPADGAPLARAGHTVTWAGDRVIVWGGRGCGGGSEACGDGAAWDPATDAWSALPSADAPSPRAFHTAVWTGTRLVVFGGQAWPGPSLGDGASYDPSAGDWSPTASNGAPSPRRRHVAVWTGEEMLVWGGDGGSTASVPLGDGARYDPGADRWTPMAGAGAPEGRWSAAAVWTGSELVIWGGVGCGPSAELCGTGAAYDPRTDRWRALPTKGAPTARSGHGAVWTGERLLVWGGGGGDCGQGAGGVCSDGASLDPAASAWTGIAAPGAGAARGGHVTLWTGSAMLVWGGSGPGEAIRVDGLRFVP